jgi:hypothetical protein
MSAALAYDESLLGVPCLYRTEKDLLDRLDGVIVRYDGLPYYCVYYGPLKLMLYPLVDTTASKGMIVDPDDPKLDISIPECRYVNHEYPKKLTKIGYPTGPVVYYVTRDPTKMWKQGFAPGYSKFQNIEGKQAQACDPTTISRGQGMYDSLTGVYPTLEETFSIFKDVGPGAVRDIAVSRDVAFRKSEVDVVFVYYRTDLVGWMAPGSTKVNVVESDLGWVIERHLKRLSLV